MAAHGFAKIFKKNSEEEREHAFKLVDYQNMRGGRVVFQDIAKPTKVEWASAQEAVEAALELEKTVNQVFSFYLFYLVFFRTQDTVSRYHS